MCNGNDQIKLFLQQPLHSNTLFVFFLLMLEHQPINKQIPLDLLGHLKYILGETTKEVKVLCKRGSTTVAEILVGRGGDRPPPLHGK